MLMLKHGANFLGTRIPTWTDAAMPPIKNGAGMPGQGTQKAPVGNASAPKKSP
jgi:hypothetical protein